LRCRVTTISQWVAATEMNDASGSLRVCHTSPTKGDGNEHRSNVNSSAARFIGEYDELPPANSSAR
jgi:hypothetical protein